MAVDGVPTAFIVIPSIFGSIVILGIILTLLRACTLHGGIHKHSGGFGNIDIVNRRSYDPEAATATAIGIPATWGGGCDIGGATAPSSGWGGGCDVRGVAGSSTTSGFGGGGGSGMGGC
uniref:Uncharacterized protein n=1 Tax=Physcomitrium patens TaxID=3218 RepID=A0A2K1KC68_PHYPA|nr:hypothetical protein PHYPA_010562 [Physcomitrium patens]